MLLRQITENTNEGIFDIFKSEKELKDSPEFKGWLKLYLKNPDIAAMHKRHEEFLKYYNENMKEGLVWSRQGGKQVRKYRCTSGVRKGRTMASPASCNMPLDVSKGQTLKKTKASKQGKVKMTGIKTRAQNVRSRRLQTINRPTNKRRGGRI